MTQWTPPCDVQFEVEARSGQQNMDRDEQLLMSVIEDPSRSVMRIYRWNAPTVTLGYFQRGDDQMDSRLVHCPRVRRITGGGAILHDREWTYSCVLPATHPLRATPIRVYEVVHQAVIALLQALGVTSRLRHDSAAPSFGTGEPFLCFLRSDPRDVVVEGHKIMGSAQRRRRGTILQHGSILMQASPLTPEVRGVRDFCPDFDEQAFVKQLPAALGAAISGDYRIFDC
ncbi:MAG: hypothetical protein R3C59_26815 [Planctomycetaceae bacterium]